MVSSLTTRILARTCVGSCQVLVAVACMVTGPTGNADPVAPRQIRITRSGTVETSRFHVMGLPSTDLKTVQALGWDRARWTRAFAVHVHRKNAAAPTAIHGEYSIEDGQIVFQPGFPLKAGLTYVARFHPHVLPGQLATIPRVEQLFTVPRKPGISSTTVKQVYPSGAILPENQLKFYLHFSAPMSRGEAYRHIRLIDNQGNPVPFPFLELAEELWNPDGTRFTLLFDPGRIKRGLKPRTEVGPSLVEGKRYTLVISRGWRDASGQALRTGFRKSFQVAAPDNQQPHPGKWKISAPGAGTIAPLEVTFAEPLDHAMLHRVIGVMGPDQRPTEGTIDVQQEETRWTFTPVQPWKPGLYQLMAAQELEDRAGNSIGRRFEIDIFRKIDKQIPRQRVSLPFSINR